MTAIKLYVDSLQSTPFMNEAAVRLAYSVISKQSERLVQLIDRVLTFSRIDRGLQNYYFDNGDLGWAIQQIIEDHQEYFAKRGLTIRSEVATQLPPTRFDREAVTQAILNLLDNAVKYAGNTPEVEIGVYLSNDHIIFDLKDNGKGITQEERKKIFEAFYRSGAHPDKGGYGVGLFVTRQIMRAHGGAIELETDPCGGSRFRLVFPCIKS